jgi:hypothetical protein
MEGGEVTARDKELVGSCGDEVDGAGVPARWTVPPSDPAASSVSTRLMATEDAMATESDGGASHK